MGRHAAPFVRHVFEKFRARAIRARQAARKLGISRSRFYVLWADYLRACAAKTQKRWTPNVSGGDRREDWPKAVIDLLRKLLSARPPCSYSFAASEVHRRLEIKLDRATVRRWALQNKLAPDTRYKRKPAPVRRWQMQDVGALWQLDASPHHWFGPQDVNYPLLDILDDCSRVITRAQIYLRETLLEYFDFLPRAFLEYGLPLCLYVDYHSFFWSQRADELTQLGEALRFYEISLDYAPTPQAKGKIERAHLFWQNRLVPLFAAENIYDIARANPLIDQIRLHHNLHEKHRELRMTPQTAWNIAQKENRSVLRSAPRCPWWPYIWSLRKTVTVASDGCIPAGTTRLPVSLPCGIKLTRCIHPNGNITLLRYPPHPSELPLVIASYNASHQTVLL